MIHYTPAESEQPKGADVLVLTLTLRLAGAVHVVVTVIFCSRRKSIMKSILFATLLTSSSALVSPEEKLHHHSLQAAQLNGTAVSREQLSTSKGSLVYLDAGSSCDGKVVSGFGFTLGSCVVRDNEATGVIYSDCYKSGSQVKFTFTECDDQFCTKGCKSYQMSENSCDTDPVEPYNGAVHCDSNVEAYYNYKDLTLHSRRYYEEGDTDCSEQFGYWSSISMSCTSSYDHYCSRGNNYYYYEKKCEM